MGGPRACSCMHPPIYDPPPHRKNQPPTQTDLHLHRLAGPAARRAHAALLVRAPDVAPGVRLRGARVDRVEGAARQAMCCRDDIGVGFGFGVCVWGSVDLSCGRWDRANQSGWLDSCVVPNMHMNDPAASSVGRRPGAARANSNQSRPNAQRTHDSPARLEVIQAAGGGPLAQHAAGRRGAPVRRLHLVVLLGPEGGHHAALRWLRLEHPSLLLLRTRPSLLPAVPGRSQSEGPLGLAGSCCCCLAWLPSGREKVAGTRRCCGGRPMEFSRPRPLLRSDPSSRSA